MTAGINQVEHSSQQEAEVALRSDEIIELMRTNLDYFASVVSPETYEGKFSPMHHIIWALMIESLLSGKRITRDAVGIPRGHAKTHLLKLACCYIAIFVPTRRYILPVLNTAKMSQSFIEDVMSMLRGDNVVKLFGSIDSAMIADNADRKVFVFRGRTMILKTMGAMNSVRGTNIDNVRPDTIICDDMQDKEEAKSPELSKALQSWFVGTLLKARNYKLCSVFYVGNMYPDVLISAKGAKNPVYTCILRNLDLNPRWVSTVTGAIQADGTVIWPEVHSLEALLEDLEEDTSLGQRATWFAEVQNDPEAGAGEWFDINKLLNFLPAQGEEPLARFIMIDPSLGKKESDGQVCTMFGAYNELGLVIEEIRTVQKDGPGLVQEVLLWALEKNCPLIAAEDYGYQATLIQWFAYVARQFQIPEETITLMNIHRKALSGGFTKNIAIKDSFQQVYSGYLKFFPEAGAAYGAQANVFDVLNLNNTDDIVDCVEYGPRIWEQAKDLCLIRQRVNTTEYAVYEANTVPDDYHPATYSY